MRLERPPFGQGKTRKAFFAFGHRDMDLPDFDRPISVKENFYRSLKHQDPRWVPFPAAEMQELHMAHIADKGPEGYQLGPDLSATQTRYTYLDAFGNSWTFDRFAGGACMTPGTRICDDILRWEEQIKFPDLHEWNIEEHAENYLKTKLTRTGSCIWIYTTARFRRCPTFWAAFPTRWKPCTSSPKPAGRSSTASPTG